MSLMEEICFLEWDILWVAECTILQMLLWAYMYRCDCFQFDLPHWKRAVTMVILWNCPVGLFCNMLLSVNRLLVSYADKWICLLNHEFLTVVECTFCQLHLLRHFPLSQCTTPQCSWKKVSETLCSVMYNNNGGSPNKYDCQFLKYIFLCVWKKFH